MDENYLDNLLNEVSLDKEIDHKIEDELDSQIEKEKKQHKKEQMLSEEDAFNFDLNQEIGNIGFDLDLDFSEDQIDELDHLDNLADLDIGDLDFSDIDFNDLDMTRLDEFETENIDDLLKDFEGDLEIKESFDEEISEDNSSKENEMAVETNNKGDNNPHVDSNIEAEARDDLNEDTFDTEQFLDSLLEDSEREKQESEEITELEEESQITGEQEEKDNSAELSKEDELTDLDDLLSELDIDEQIQDTNALNDGSVAEENNVPKETNENEKQLSAKDEDDLDDLLSLLDLDEEVNVEPNNKSDNEQKEEVQLGDSVLDLSDVEDIEELETEEKSPKKKKTFMQILFGEPDEDDILSEEELAALEEKKAAKKAKKAAKKQAAEEAKKEKKEKSKEEKSAKDAQKKKIANEKKQLKAIKKQKQKEELANAEPEKKLNKPMVIFIFSLFLGGTFLFYLAANNFDYTMAIEKATKYFANQKYHKAYDEIKGVNVKEKDQELKDRIYTVMYVERLYESYQNNIKLERPEKALDALLRGVDKYYEHYDEAVELDIVSDLDYSFNQIKTLLENQYGITVEQATMINDLSDYEYVQIINEYVSKQLPVDGETGDSAKTDEETNAGNDEDAVLPKEQEEEVSE